jgi:hypothetical protein
MCHFILSMLLLDAAFALAWCARYEPGERRASSDRLGVWAVRGLIPFGQLTILAGTITTGSGPHAGDHEGELVHRFASSAAHVAGRNLVISESFTWLRNHFHTALSHMKAEADRLLGIGQSRPDPRLPAGELAAYAAVCSTLLNLDEAVTKE